MITKEKRHKASAKINEDISKISKNKKWDKTKVKEITNEPLLKETKCIEIADEPCKDKGKEYVFGTLKFINK